MYSTTNTLNQRILENEQPKHQLPEQFLNRSLRNTISLSEEPSQYTKNSPSQKQQNKTINFDFSINLQQNNVKQGEFKHYFLFVNGKSGSSRRNIGLNCGEYAFDIYKSNGGLNRVKVHFVDLAGGEDKTEAFQQIKRLSIVQTVYCIVCGGDGSIMWMVQQLSEAGIDFSSVVIGTIPLGTGNDFSRAIGWGPGTDMKKLCKNDYRGLKELVSKWISAKVSNFDIWDIELEVQKGGYFTQISKDSQGNSVECKLKDPQFPLEYRKIFHKSMSNYFSFGIDARIGLAFDKKRTKSRTCNNCMYVWEGFKKLFLSTPKINQTLYSLELINNKFQPLNTQNSISSLDTEENSETSSSQHTLSFNQSIELQSQSQSQSQSQQVPKISNRNHSITLGNDLESQLQDINPTSPNQKMIFKLPQEELFVTRGRNTIKEDEAIIKQLVKGKKLNPEQQEKLKQKQEKIYMNGRPATFLIQNIDSYCGGTSGIWDGSKNRLGLVNFQNVNQLHKKQKFSKQSFSDGKLEMLQFQSYGSLICETLCNGHSQRMAQGSGPFLFNFRERNEQNQMLQNYFQIDGEYFGVYGLKTTQIRKSQLAKNGKIQILVEECKYQQYQNKK